jgi:GNAT superfamily N-acetyltransferase
MTDFTHQFEISEFEEADRTQLRELYQTVKQQTFGAIGLPEEDTDTFDADTDNEEILVARLNGAPVGFVAIWVPENFIHHLYVQKDSQGKGIGSALIVAVRARWSGALTLKCIEKNVEAVKFYKKNGWKVVSRGVTEHGPFLLFELP